MKKLFLIGVFLVISLNLVAQKPWSIGLETGREFAFRTLTQPPGYLQFQNSPIRLQRIGLKIIRNPDARHSWETGLYKLGPSIGATYYPGPGIDAASFYSVALDLSFQTGGVPATKRFSLEGPLWAVPMVWRRALINRDGMAIHVRAGVQSTWNLGVITRNQVVYRGGPSTSIVNGDTTVTDLRAIRAITVPRLHLSAQLGVEGTFRVAKHWYGFGNLSFNYGLHEKQRTVNRYTYNQDPEREATYRSRGTGYQWGLGLRYQFR